MIVTEESTTRVERVEWRMWLENGLGASAFVILGLYFTSLPNRPLTYFAAAGAISLGFLLLITGIRRRPVCVIEPTRIGYGFLGKKNKMWWFDRDRLGSVLVRKRPLIEVRFYGQDGKLFDSSVFAYFDPKELRQAFESAGIPVR